MGWDPKAYDYMGSTALLVAARLGHASLCDYLCQCTDAAFADHTTTTIGLSAMGEAAKQGHADTLRILIERGCNVMVRRRNQLIN